jgi:hypothetical protein
VQVPLQLFHGDVFEDFRGARIRKTDDIPPRISVYDFIQAVTGNSNPRVTWADVSKRLADNGATLSEIYALHRFHGAGQRETPVTDANGVVRILNFLSGRRAEKFRDKCADIIVRYLGGDETLIAEIRRIRDVQEQLPSDHPLRVFGEEVEARAAPVVEDEDQRALKHQRVLNEMELDKAKHANEMARLRMQSSQELVEGSKRLLDTLADGFAPPALTGLLNAARHNLATRCLSVMGVGESVTTDAPLGNMVAAIRRVTVQEFGRDVLGLAGNDLSTSRLSSVGSKLGRLWKGSPGKGEIMSIPSESSEKRWKRTHWENGTNGANGTNGTNGTIGTTQTAVLEGDLDQAAMASNRIKFSATYLGTNEIGNGQAYDVWTYQLDQVDAMMREAFRM